MKTRHETTVVGLVGLVLVITGTILNRIVDRYGYSAPLGDWIATMNDRWVGIGDMLGLMGIIALGTWLGMVYRGNRNH